MQAALAALFSCTSNICSANTLIRHDESVHPHQLRPSRNLLSLSVVACHSFDSSSSLLWHLFVFQQEVCKNNCMNSYFPLIHINKEA